jgi:hypothetical protein
VSVFVHALPSLHPVPSDTGTAEHAPVAELQVPALQASVNELQSLGVPPTHVRVDRLHFSTPLHGL